MILEKKTTKPEKFGNVSARYSHNKYGPEIKDGAFIIPYGENNELRLLSEKTRFVLHQTRKKEPCDIHDIEPGIEHTYWYGGDRGNGSPFLEVIKEYQGQLASQGEKIFYDSLRPWAIIDIEERMSVRAFKINLSPKEGALFAVRIAGSWDALSWFSYLFKKAAPTKVTLGVHHLSEGCVIRGEYAPNYDFDGNPQKNGLLLKGEVVKWGKGSLRGKILARFVDGIYFIARSEIPL